jgi:hypothetical protein
MLGRGASFGVALASAIGLGLGWCLPVAIFDLAMPGFVPRSLPVRSAVMWTPRAAEWTLVPYARPLHEPTLRLSDDGSVLVAEAFDARRAVQRFDEGRFVAAADPRDATPPRAPAVTDALLHVAGGTWLAVSSGRHATTSVLRSGAWTPGPAVPEDHVLVAVAALGDGRLCAYCTDPYGNEPVRKVCTAREGDAAFRVVPAPDLQLNATPWTVAAAGSGEVLIVVKDSDAGVRMQLVDADTGAVRAGPALPEPFASTPLTWTASAASLDDGRVLLAPAVLAMASEWRPEGTPAALLALVLVGSGIAAAAVFRARLAIGWALAGVVLAPAVGMMLAIGLYLLARC